MTIRHIVLRKGIYYFYGDYSERNLIATVSQKEVGEVVGYNHEYMLCLKGNKYAVRSLGKEEVMSFCAFTNPYPMKISFTIGNIRDCVRVEDEDDEARWRKLIRQIKGLPGKTAEEKIKAIVEHLDEDGSTASLITLYRSCDKDFAQFLDKALKLYPFDSTESLRNLAFDLLHIARSQTGEKDI